MDLEQKYDFMSEHAHEKAAAFYSDWIEKFENAEASGDDMNVIQLIAGETSPYCLWKILQYLKPIVQLEQSSDPIDRWRGFLARINSDSCRNTMRANADKADDEKWYEE